MAFENMCGEGVVLPGAGKARSQERFAQTPVYDLQELVKACREHNVIPKMRFHVGEGVFVRFCSDCGDYTLEWGSILTCHEMDQHVVNTHGREIPAILGF